MMEAVMPEWVLTAPQLPIGVARELSSRLALRKQSPDDVVVKSVHTMALALFPSEGMPVTANPTRLFCVLPEHFISSTFPVPPYSTSAVGELDESRLLDTETALKVEIP
jgi:hypothetical protein